MRQEQIIEDIKNHTVGLDDTFKFHCTRCGKCCIHRTDILLSPTDIFKLAKGLHMKPVEVFRTYCESYIGENSRVPLVRLLPIGADDRCPFLKGNACSVHAFKPAVCGMFPLGRYLSFEKEAYTPEAVASAEVKYLAQNVECGDGSETHTVREWLSDFDISQEDACFKTWNQILSAVGNKLRSLEKSQDMFTMMEVWYMVRISIYLAYDTSKEFLPQMESNFHNLMALLEDIPRLKGLMRNALRGS